MLCSPERFRGFWVAFVAPSRSRSPANVYMLAAELSCFALVDGDDLEIVGAGFSDD
jgi:hypothetical protein